MTSVTSPAANRVGLMYRVVGAAVAGALGIGAMSLAYAVAADPRVDAVVHLHELLGREGFGRGDVSGALLWSVAPVSAAWSATLLTSRAIAADRWTGAVMGGLTYAIACAIGPVIAVGTMMSEANFADPAMIDPIGWAGAAGFGAGIALVLLYPLLLVCLLAGQVWAEVMRAVGRSWLGVAGPGPRPFPGALIALSVGVLGVGWLGLAWLLGFVLGDPGAID